MAPEQRDALTELVRQQVGEGRRYSTRAFAEIAVDGATGWTPSKSLVGKIINGDRYNVTPQLISALSVGLGLPREVVAAAAHFQVIGYSESELSQESAVTLIHKLGQRPSGTPKSEAIAERWSQAD